MQELTKKLKAELYEELGFKYTSNESSSVNVLEAVNLGENFRNLCHSLDLDADIVESYITKYVLHLILEESTNLCPQEIDLARSFFDEPLCDTTIGEVLEDMQNKMYYVHSKNFQNHLYETLKLKNNQSADEESDYFVEGQQQSANLIYPFTERQQVLYPLYFKSAVNKKKSIKPRADRDFDSNSFVKDLFSHYEQFTSILTLYGNEINPTRDILEIERDTNIYFLLKVWSLLPQDMFNKFNSKKDKSSRNNYFNILASFSLIEDVRLKLYIAEQFIKEDVRFPFTKGNGYMELFSLIYIYIPLLKEYFLDQIKVPEGTLTIKNREITEINDARDLKRIKKKLYCYQILKESAGYKLTDLSNESIFQIDGTKIDSTEDFSEFYKKVKNVSGFRRDFYRESLDNLFEIIKKKPGLVEACLYDITQKFIAQQKHRISKVKKKSDIEKNLQIFSETEFDVDAIKEKFNNANIDIEKIFLNKI